MVMVEGLNLKLVLSTVMMVSGFVACDESAGLALTTGLAMTASKIAIRESPFMFVRK
jgi:hypothetical protein